MDIEKKHTAYRENAKIAFDLAGEYAKWLLSTLLILNSGAIAGIFQKDAAHLYLVSVCLFAAGVFFALASGCIGWFNLQFAASYYEDACSRVLARQAELAVPNSVKLTVKMAIIAAFLSIGCLALGATFIAFALR
jgi:hypothetical protein